MWSSMGWAEAKSPSNLLAGLGDGEGRVEETMQPTGCTEWSWRTQPLFASEGFGALMTDDFSLQQTERAHVNNIWVRAEKVGMGWPTS